MRSDREHWDAAYARGRSGEASPPAAFLAEHASLLRVGRTLDLACGRGRNARFLAERGHTVVAVDVSREAIADPALRSPAIAPVQMDLDAAAFRAGSLDGIVCVSFLDRRLFASLPVWIRPGGTLLLDTFLVDQAAIGHPRNPAYLLSRNELLERVAPAFRVLRYREGIVEENGVRSARAGIVAER
ncbi:MAG: class I SAM-dependent methyltransferase, partial [Candidatus Binatia bacterium]